LLVHNVLRLVVCGLSLCLYGANTFAGGCRDCAEIVALKSKLAQAVKVDNYREEDAVISKLVKAIKRISTDDGVFEPEQVKLIISVIHLDKHENDRLVLLEDTFEVFLQNRDRFAMELSGRKDADFKQILNDIDSIIHSMKYGQNSSENVQRGLSSDSR
jgi:hypothetical protein